MAINHSNRQCGGDDIDHGGMSGPQEDPRREYICNNCKQEWAILFDVNTAPVEVTIEENS